jgi:hypothetical protein
MKKIAGIGMCLLALGIFYSAVQAGDLEPPGPPGPTMVTLQSLVPAQARMVSSRRASLSRRGSRTTQMAQ